MKFSELELSEDVLRAVTEAGYTEPTPVQEQAIPQVLMGRDVLACAQTGTGKTASFTLPMIDILAAGRAKARMPRSIILEPTRELAAQVADNFDIYGKYHKLTKALLIGGVSMDDQIKVLDRGVDVLIATPGRLLDLFGRGRLLLNDVKILVIDETDRMLDMGFIPDVERIVSLTPKMRQTLFFSATMPPEIRRLGEAFLMNPKEIHVSPPATTAANVIQGMITIRHNDGPRPGGGQKEKRQALRQLISNDNVKNALVFCNRKRDVGVLHRSLNRHGFNAAQLHGDMVQSVRMETLAAFKRGEMKFLVCSDVAARGLDIQDMSHVFNFDVPTSPEDYVHRIGRTGRAGRIGHAYTLALPEDAKYIQSIVRLIGKDIPRITLDGEMAPEAKSAAVDVDAGVNAGVNSNGGKGEEVREQAPPRRRRRRSGGRGRKTGGENKLDAAPESRPHEKPAEAQPKAGEADGRQHRRQTEERANKPVVGMGDHVPAFMQRPSKPPTGR
jgi:superfamily II DNA/RNA helicase